jgi:rubredoxin
MFTEITAAYQSLSTVVQLAKTVQQAATQVEKNEVLLGMQNAVLDLQSKMMAMHAKMDELAEVRRAAEAKLIAYENWNAEAEKYQLFNIGFTGRLVMALKPSHAAGAPDHWLCPNCFEKKEKSYLNRENARYTEFKCIRCGYKVNYDASDPREIRPREVRVLR